MARILPGGAQPEQDERHAHDDVAHDQQSVVGTLAISGIREADREAECQDDDTDHLRDGRDAEERIVIPVGGGEPREVQPRPRDGEDGERVRGEPRTDLALDDRVRELVCRGRERDDIREVVEQLERCDGAVALIRIPAGHRPQPMPEVVLQSRCELPGRHWSIIRPASPRVCRRLLTRPRRNHALTAPGARDGAARCDGCLLSARSNCGGRTELTREQAMHAADWAARNRQPA